MIRHIVLFRLKDKSPENLKATAELFYTLRGKVPGLISVCLLYTSHGVIAFGHVGYETISTGNARRAHYVCARGSLCAIGNVVGNRAVKQKYVLQHHRYLSAQRMQRELADIVPVYQYASRIRVVKSLQQRNYRGLTYARGA